MAGAAGSNGSPPEVEVPDGERLQQLSEAELEDLSRRLAAAEAALKREMAPLQGRLAGLGQDQALLATEVRRRERARHLAGRQQVRQQVKEGAAPSLAALLASPDPLELGEPDFAELSFLLATGGEVALGYPGSQAPSLQMTDGRAVSSAASLARARELYRLGWECGVPARRGVRVHTPGTRLERLLAPDDLYVRARPPGQAGASG
ncbi:MAG: hypothetical protein ACREOD_08650 [Candidatus Dormibacteria bacterium]